MTDTTYALQIRLQACVSALQSLVYAGRDVEIDTRDNLDAEVHSAFVAALNDASTALDIAFGATHEIPASITRDWRDKQMVRDATAVLSKTAG